MSNSLNCRGGQGIFILIFIPMITCVLSSFIGTHILANLCSYIITLPIIFPLIRTKGCNKFGLEVYILILFLCVFLYGYTYSIAKQSAWEKLVLIIYNDLIPCIMIMYILRKSPDPHMTLSHFVRLAMKYSEVILFIFGVLYLVGYREIAIDGRTYVKGLPGPIWASRYSCMLLIFLLYKKFRYRQKTDVIFVTTLLLAIYMIYMGDSRGPLLAAAVCLFVILAKSLSSRWIVFLVLFFILIIYLYLSFSPRVSSGGSEYSTLGRLALFEQFRDADFDLLKGVGLGSWNMLTIGEDTLFYPHNIIIETITEIGIIGLSLLIFLFVKFFKKKDDYIIFYMCMFFMINSMISGDVTSNSNLFFFLIMSSVYHDYKKDIIPVYSPQKYKQ